MKPAFPLLGTINERVAPEFFNARCDMPWQERVLIPLVAILRFHLTAILIPLGIIALIQWRKVAVARYMREMVGELAKQGFEPGEIERLLNSFRMLQAAPTNKVNWVPPESQENTPHE